MIVLEVVKFIYIMLVKKVFKVLKSCKLMAVLSVIFFLYFFGVFAMILETDYKYFEYPLEGNITALVIQMRSGKTPYIDPINFYNHSFVYTSHHKCSNKTPLRLVYLVKSAREHFDRRKAIRETWGYEKRFSDVPVRTVFLLGSSPDNHDGLDRGIHKEQEQHGDIVLADFVDAYRNNTIKTMMGHKWAVTYCNTSKFYFFSDDDMFVSTKNVLRFLRNPLEYPDYLETPVSYLNSTSFRKLRTVIDYELPEDVVLFAGALFSDSRPMRHISSKWYIPVSEYKFNRWPPYLSAGSFIESNAVLNTFYHASFFVKHFVFDDVYLGILSKKTGIALLHNRCFRIFDNFNFHCNPNYIISSHDFDDPSLLIRIWNEQKSSGNA